MAMLDVADILTDPDFLSEIILIRRRYPVPELVDARGRTIFIEEPQGLVWAVVVDIGGEYLTREAGGAYHVDKLTVFYRGELIINRPPYYSDIIIWNNKRYVVDNLFTDALNWGKGWTKAECIQEDLHE